MADHEANRDDFFAKLREELRDEDEMPKTEEKTTEGDAKPKRTVRPPDYSLKPIGAELPPPPAPKPRAKAEKRPEVVANMRQAAEEFPGEWVIIATYPSKTGAKTTYKAIMSGKQAIPAGIFDLDYRPQVNENNERVGGSELIARYIGADDDEANAFEAAAGGPYVSAYNPPKDDADEDAEDAEDTGDDETE